jgi:hypothetical protein
MEFFALAKQFFIAGLDTVAGFNRYLAGHFGRAVQLATDWMLLGLLLALAMRLFHLSFDVLRYVLLPSLVVSGLVAAFTSFSFGYVLPFAMGIGTIVLLYKS